MTHFTIATVNVSGVSFLKTPAGRRDEARRHFNSELAALLARFEPHVLLVQELVQYQESETSPVVLSIDPLPDYFLWPTIIIDSGSTATGHHPKKWSPIRQAGGWDSRARFGQGNGILFRRDLPHASLWEADRFATRIGPDLECEDVALEMGLYTGDRDTEPRRATVARFVLDGKNIVVINAHLSTLKRERECFPERDAAGSALRVAQAEIILNGIVSRWNEWRAAQAPYELADRALFILGGDLNATPGSPELGLLLRFFVDLAPEKRSGTKRARTGDFEGLVVDHLLAGVRHHSFDPQVLEAHMGKFGLAPIEDFESSDHRPLVASIPLSHR